MPSPVARGRDERLRVQLRGDNQFRTEHGWTGRPIWQPSPVRWINAARYGSLYLRLLLRRIAAPPPAPGGYIVPDGTAVGWCGIYSRHVLISASRHRSSASSLQSSLFPAPYMPRYGPAAGVSAHPTSAPFWEGIADARSRSGRCCGDIAIEIRRREVI